MLFIYFLVLNVGVHSLTTSDIINHYVRDADTVKDLVHLKKVYIIYNNYDQLQFPFAKLAIRLKIIFYQTNEYAVLHTPEFFRSLSQDVILKKSSFFLYYDNLGVYVI